MVCRDSQWSVCFGIVLWCFTSLRDCETPCSHSVIVKNSVLHCETILSSARRRKRSEKEWERETLVPITPAINVSLMLSGVQAPEVDKLLMALHILNSL